MAGAVLPREGLTGIGFGHRKSWVGIVIHSMAVILSVQCMGEGASSLRLVPFPKEVQILDGVFEFRGPLVLEAPSDRCVFLAELLADDLKRNGAPSPAHRAVEGSANICRLISPAAQPIGAAELPERAGEEAYSIRIGSGGVVIAGGGRAGLLHGVQTLVQLVRANSRGGALPCLVIRDWPSLRWRCFQNDLTRGPSARIETLERQLALGALLKMNLFTYYMEHQYAFTRHPEIGPPDGSLTPGELRRLVECGRPAGVEILGNQQSFGHMGHILKHERYAELRENDQVLTPSNEGTYRLLDDLYSEVCPLLPFPFFNVCCDETWGLGSGPSKALADQIGVGGVYLRHVRRVHDLLAGKYGKRMMMWGDIILKHADELDQIPEDTTMLTWGYGALPSFEAQITPFQKSGFEFFVCPGVSDWRRILPDFAVATTNIQNFVRDGARLGAIGMLNTEWKDDGESLNAPNWHGYAWGAECAWNASATDPADFNRRIGAVLFGEPGGRFGRAIGLLSGLAHLPMVQGMMNQRFWEKDLPPSRSGEKIRADASRVLALVRPALEELRACRLEAVTNADLIDAVLFGAERIEWLALRRLNALEMVRLYEAAYDGPASQAGPFLERAAKIARENAERQAALGNRFAELWLAENKPHALDWTQKRYAAFTADYELYANRLEAAHGALSEGRPLPAPEQIGMASWTGGRRSRPQAKLSTTLESSLSWEDTTATHRFELAIDAGRHARRELPVEIDLSLPDSVARRPIRAFCTISPDPPKEVLAQLDPSGDGNRARLTLFVPGPIPEGGRAIARVYLGLRQAPTPLPGAVHTRDGDRGTHWIENDKVRLLLGREGAHVYRWEVKGLEGRDITMPGENGWAGFSDLGGANRTTRHELSCAARGPALVRYRCIDGQGAVKTIGVFGSASWMEIILEDPVSYYWDFDAPSNFAADGPTPGQYLFSTGASGPVGKGSNGVAAQVRTRGAHWGIKYNADRLALGLATPEVAAGAVVGPGAGAGGVGIERAPGAAHFVTYCGLLTTDARTLMDGLCRTLNFNDPVRVTVYAIQPRSK